MKKTILYVILLVCGLVFLPSCEKDEIGGTETEQMAGQWYVVADAIDANGNVVYTDDELFGIGHFHLDTYNLSSNSPTEMWIDDGGNFWDFKTKINVDLKSMTFSSTADSQNVSYDSKLTIKDGKILKGAATTPSGMPADSIVFTVSFDDDPYPSQLGYAAYRIAGYRYTGFAGDD